MKKNLGTILVKVSGKTLNYMAIVGNIIKKAIEFSDKISTDSSAIENQEKVLRELLQKARKTEFGSYYNFDQLLQAKDIRDAFKKQVPLHNYHKMHEAWWSKTEAGKADITWPGKPEYLALSSGTTSGSSKKIPVTEDMLDETRKTSMQQIVCLANFDLPAEFFEKEILMLSSSTNLIQGDHYLEGDISGISAAKIPFWFKSYCRPGDPIFKIDNFDERIQQIAEHAGEWDIGSLSGIPSWIELMLKKVISYNNLNNIHEIWPNLKVFATGGVAFGPYKKSFEKLLAHPLIYIDTYFASEGFFAFQTRPETNAMALALDNGIYFEFVPFKEENITEEGEIKPGATVLKLEELMEGEEYALIVSTVAGSWRYILGDTIKLTNKDRYEIEITGRTSHFLNVVGSKLSVNMMNAAMQILERELNITIKEFTVAAVLNEDNYAHKWYIGSDDPADPVKVAQLLDSTLQRMNRSYSTARKQALKNVFIEMIPPDLFYDWNEIKNKKGGQVKTPRVMKEEQFVEWERFVKESLSKKAIL